MAVRETSCESTTASLLAGAGQVGGLPAPHLLDLGRHHLPPDPLDHRNCRRQRQGQDDSQDPHQLPADQIPEGDEIMAFEVQALADAGFNYDPVAPRYRTPYFSHIMGGYAAGYYSYIWSEVLDADTVEWFRQNGGLLRANGERFRELLLSQGGSVDAMTLYREFAGREPDMVHMLRRRGLAEQVEP